MSHLSLRLPESLHKQVKALAKEEGMSINQFITTALAEKLSALMTEDYLGVRAKRSNQAALEQAAAKVSNTEPEVCDHL